MRLLRTGLQGQEHRTPLQKQQEMRRLQKTTQRRKEQQRHLEAKRLKPAAVGEAQKGGWHKGGE